jgi:hypothetical protein
MGVTYDKYGHCVLCHKDMIYEQVIGQKVTKRFSVDYDETEYLLDDNSRMRVAICKPCKEGITEKDNDKIMKSVQEGWEEEVKTLPWKEEKKKAYLDRYGKLEIVCFSGGIPEDILKEKHTDYMKKKEGKNGHNK